MTKHSFFKFDYQIMVFSVFKVFKQKPVETPIMKALIIRFLEKLPIFDLPFGEVPSAESVVFS